MVQKLQGFYLTLFFIIGSCFYSKAEIPQQYRFSVLDNHSGLTHNQVNCFFKDRRGYIWIGTGSGLNRYNGYQLDVFRNDPSDSSSIRGNIIISIFEDPKGFVWIETDNGYSIYDPVKEIFSGAVVDFLIPYNLPTNDINDIYKDEEGNYWFIQNGVGITKYNPLNKKSTTLTQVNGSKNTLHNNIVAGMDNNSEGDYWVLYENGMLEKLDGESLKVIEQIDFIYQKYNGQQFDYKFLVDGDNDLWIYLPSSERGIYYFNDAEDTFLKLQKGVSKQSLNSNLVTGAVEESRGKIWIGTDHGGINVVNKEDFSIDYIFHNSENPKSLVHNSIYSLYKDKDDIIWIGAYKNGVNYYHKNIIRFNHFKNYASQPTSLPFDDVNRFAEDEKGNLWIGTNGGGLLYFDREKGTFKRYRHDPEDPNSISADVIVSLLVTKDNNLWIGTYHGGLSKFDGEEFTHYNTQSKAPYHLPDDNIWELFEDSKGNIWIGTVGVGVLKLNPSTGEFRHYKPDESSETIDNSYVAAIEEDEFGRIWIGGNEGIDIIYPGNGKIVHFANEKGNGNSLPSNTVFSIFKDSQKRIWVATEEGLALYSNENFSSKITIGDGLPHHAVLTILEDNDNNLWLGTPNGLANIIFEEGEGLSFKIRKYEESDGLQEMVFNENAAFKTSKGQLIFGGPNGFNMFDPSKLLLNSNTPKVVFTDFKLFGESLAVGQKVGDRVILPKSLAFIEDITLKHDENFFSVEFAALSFFQPEKNRYKYKLLGFDKIWHYGDNNNRSITYTNLDPGNYELIVIASNNDGSWNESGKSLKITVLAPFWKTGEAYALYSLLILAGLYLGRRIMLQRERAKFRIEQERREAKQMHDLDLMKIRFLTNVSHEFRTPLSLILAPIEKMLEKNGESVYQKQFEMIHRNARRLLNLVNQLLDFRKIELDGIKLHLSEGNVVKFIEESVHSFSDLSEKKNIRLSFQSNVEELKTSFDMDKLEKVLFNLLSNAFKFTPEDGEIQVEVNCLENDSGSEGIKILEIKVKDSGIGIPADMQDKIFERFFRNDLPSSMVNQGSGIGLSITKEFVRLQGGTITVDSVLGSGSCFTVNIPVKEMQRVVVGTKRQNEQRLTETKDEDSASVAKIENRGSSKKPAILIVEDNEDFRFYLRDNLDVHFNIIEAKNGIEGWQKALSEMPDLIVSDLMMPEMDGIEFCQKIKKDSRTSHIPFVLLTARSAEEQKLKGLNIGANDYVTKPFNFEILLSRLKNLISQQNLLHKILEKKISVQTSDVDITSLDDKLIREAIKLVEGNITDPDFSVEILSKELGMSRANLYKKLVSLTGQSPLEFIRKIRLQRAAQYLEKSQLTVAEVAYKVGFNSPKYFTKYFKKEFNISPSLYGEDKEP